MLSLRITQACAWACAGVPIGLVLVLAKHPRYAGDTLGSCPVSIPHLGLNHARHGLKDRRNLVFVDCTVSRIA